AAIERGAAIAFGFERLLAGGHARRLDAAVGATATARVANPLVVGDAAAEDLRFVVLAADLAAFFGWPCGFLSGRGRWRQGDRLFRRLSGVFGRFAVGVFEVDETVAVVIGAVRAGRRFRGRDRDARFRRQRLAFGERVGGGDRRTDCGQPQQAGKDDDR